MTTNYPCGHSVEPEIAALVCPVCERLFIEKQDDELIAQSDHIASLLLRNEELRKENLESRYILHGIWEIICEEYGNIEYNIMKGCRCLRCNEYQVRDMEGKIIARGDTLKELVDNYYARNK